MNISILGCGWLGLPLAENLIKRGHAVKGSTTTKSKIQKLESRSIEPFLLKLDPEFTAESTIDNFFQSQALVLNIPPGLGRDNVAEYHSRQIQSVIDQLDDSPVHHVIFASSTSVYPAFCGKVTEGDAIRGRATRDSGEALLHAERLLMKSEDFATTVLRFGGLIGGGRHPAKYLAGRKDLPKAHAPVNLIHREDGIHIITQIIEEHIAGEIFNAVSDGHPTRKNYYTKAAQAMGLEPPAFKSDDEQKYKVVLNQKIKQTLQYRFIHSSPWR